MHPYVDLLNVLNAVAAVALAAFVFTSARRRNREIPMVVWLGIAYIGVQFLLSLNRVLAPWMWQNAEVFTAAVRATVLDSIGTVIAVLLLTHVRRITRMVESLVDQARLRANEYRRARMDYTQVVRHRVMNPLTVIRGASVTLRSGAVTDPKLAAQLFDAIDAATEMIESETLEPERRDELERELQAVPHPFVAHENN